MLVDAPRELQKTACELHSKNRFRQNTPHMLNESSISRVSSQAGSPQSMINDASLAPCNPITKGTIEHKISLVIRSRCSGLHQTFKTCKTRVRRAWQRPENDNNLHRQKRSRP